MGLWLDSTEISYVNKVAVLCMNVGLSVTVIFEK